jgi:hypothetical protein
VQAVIIAKAVGVVRIVLIVCDLVGFGVPFADTTVRGKPIVAFGIFSNVPKQLTSHGIAIL